MLSEKLLENRSLQPSFKQWQRWGQRDIRWQPVPDTCGSHRKGSVTDGGETCRWNKNNERRCRRRPQPLPGINVSDTVKLLGEVRWRQAVKTAVYEHRQPVLDTLLTSFVNNMAAIVLFNIEFCHLVHYTWMLIIAQMGLGLGLGFVLFNMWLVAFSPTEHQNGDFIITIW